MPSIVRFSLIALVALACMAPVTAAEDSAERFTFTVPNAPESTVDDDRFTLTINRWSTDAERQQMLSVIKERGNEQLLDAFRETGAVGYLRWPGGLEYSVRYAYREERPDGSADVVLVVDRPLWVWWDAGVTTSPEKEGTAPFATLHIRVTPDGRGEGRVAYGPSGIEVDDRLGVLVPDVAAHPVLLNDVRRDERG